MWNIFWGNSIQSTTGVLMTGTQRRQAPSASRGLDPYDELLHMLSRFTV